MEPERQRIMEPERQRMMEPERQRIMEPERQRIMEPEKPQIESQIKQQKPELKNINYTYTYNYNQAMLIPHYYDGISISKQIMPNDKNIKIENNNNFIINNIPFNSDSKSYNAIAFINKTSMPIVSITFNYNISLLYNGLWIYAINENGKSTSGWYTIYSYNNSDSRMTYNTYIKPNEGIVFNMTQLHGSIVKLNILNFVNQNYSIDDIKQLSQQNPKPNIYDELLDKINNNTYYNASKPNIIDRGYSNMYRGWYDVLGRGIKNDYCRFVGNYPNIIFNCMLAGTNEPYSPIIINPNQDNDTYNN